MPVTDFELQTSEVGGDRSVNCTKATDHLMSK